jgi:hypothetical protein
MVEVVGEVKQNTASASDSVANIASLAEEDAASAEEVSAAAPVVTHAPSEAESVEEEDEAA